MVWPNDVVAGAERRTRLVRPDYGCSIAGTANRLQRSSAPDDDVPQIASAFGLLDPRPIIHQ